MPVQRFYDSGMRQAAAGAACRRSGRSGDAGRKNSAGPSSCEGGVTPFTTFGPSLHEAASTTVIAAAAKKFISFIVILYLFV
jgi:hypothetical protein